MTLLEKIGDYEFFELYILPYFSKKKLYFLISELNILVILILNIFSFYFEYNFLLNSFDYL